VNSAAVFVKNEKDFKCSDIQFIRIRLSSADSLVSGYETRTLHKLGVVIYFSEKEHNILYHARGCSSIRKTFDRRQM